MAQIRYLAQAAFGVMLALSGLAPAASAQVVERDSLALWDLYWNHYWSIDSPIHTWFRGPVSTFEGVEISDGRVTALRVDSSGLGGEFPTSLFALDSLEVLDLSYNDFSGPLPSGSGKLRALRYFDISNNRFTGVLPAWTRGFRAPRFFSVGNNDLGSGFDLVPGQYSGLEVLSLFGNNMRLVSLGFLRSMQGLEILDLRDVHFTGPIPDWIGELANLSELRVELDTPSTSIPEGLARLIRLEVLEIDGRAALPRWIGRLSTLKVLALHGGFRGTIPDSVGNLAGLQSLMLYGNDLVGAIPSTIGDLEHLQGLNLRGSSFSGPIPPSLGQLSKLETLDLSDNELSGGIPESFGSLTSLRTLYVDRNPDLAGPLPNSLANLVNIQSLRYENTNLCVYQGSEAHLWSRRVTSYLRLCTGTNREANDDIPYEIELGANFPEPVSNGTTIRFALPSAADVRLFLYDAAGKQVQSWVLGHRPEGGHEVYLDTSRLAPGLYLYRLSVGRVTRTESLVVAR